MTEAALARLDHAALRFNQAAIIAALAAAFVLDAPWLAALVGLVMAAGALLGRPGFLPLYRALRAAGLLRPDVIADHAEPHRFAQALGAAVLLAAAGAFAVGWSAAGWGLAALVAGLAALNLFGGFCAGCALYYWLSRLHLPGFTRQPPPGARAGQRPPRSP